MKNPWEWDENDLLDIIKTATQESIELDFKDSKALQNVKGQRDVRYEISKDVSALANSAGGTLIYGIVEDKSTHMAAHLDAGNDPTVITKEWLQQVINSTIHRKIEGVRIKQIPLIISSPGKFAYIVYVPQSTRTPHQALDKKFYKRYEFESVPMEEYEVRDLYHRDEVPDLRIAFTLPKTEIIMNQETSQSEPFGLRVAIYNDALEPANYAIIRILIDSRIIVENANGLIKREGLLFRIEDYSHPVTALELIWSIPKNLPIYKQPYPFPLTDNTMPIMLKTTTDGRPGKNITYLLGYEITSPRMNIKNSLTFLQIKSGYATLADTDISPEELIADHDNLELLKQQF